ncbi:DUF3558 domain-containing protein [Mycobacterium sp. CBMA271]|uniref:DUF3558 domain-containing protein n=1 Tax=unclassified Mycobacteroides TaxID=2618759 RepID=UPI0012DCB605|nr:MULTISPECIES: DUF3558 domain-containing protein [unclassified Mycobacteroides]MUM16003.1 hypothetical protein [Mycobacteroides sp. CBMA 326]MUM22497.1 DUF3558 domain-containing protein [Mycobacteroides sp. CBMA 271]
MLGLATLSCTEPVVGTPTTSPLPTNKSGHTRITWEPCTEIPSSVIAEQQLDARPPERKSLGTDGVMVIGCKYKSRTGYYFTIDASNYTLKMDKKDDTHWDYRDFEINGRTALSYYVSSRPHTDGCAIDVAATTGLYGVMVSDGNNGFAPYPDCLAAARANIEALLPYFPY